MKVTLFFAVLCCFVAVSFAATRCSKQSDCEPDECCLDSLFFKHAFCEPRYRAGQRCPTASIYRLEEDLFYFACPCVDKYECLGKGSLENGVTVIKDAKCIIPTI
ncbi:toxin CSTX-20 [Trichonephila clavipes]|uniref:Toxin CSTX-20 n=1 Tax=Trichonephila inaurata madagascariensis TaxID=2747483 RepID=A0A8X6I8C1_9ARAC|nr:toxin CSTX-20 [Trichonephila inaurata madagascariensis]GFS53292.1 toxin CSTX-20 [Trichonephila clavipes]